MSEEQTRELGSYLGKKNWWVIADEIYEYLSFSRPHRSLLELAPELRERFILINGFSKAFCMTGWRVGYGVGPQAVMNLVRSLQSHSSTCLPMFIEDAALVAIEAGKPLMKGEIAAMDALRKVAIEEFRKVPGLKFVEPQGAFYVFLDFRGFLKGRFERDNGAL